MKLLSDYLNELAYPAELAGLYYALQNSQTGFQVRLDGLELRLNLAGAARRRSLGAAEQNRKQDRRAPSCSLPSSFPSLEQVVASRYSHKHSPL